jgi:predicted nucleic acid-binding protein
LIIVSDAGALIDLADADCLEILHEIYEEVIVPLEVFEEVFKRRIRVKPKWIKIRSAEKADVLKVFSKIRLAVDIGEAAAIAVALEIGVPVIMEDKAGMLQCELHKVEYVSLFRLLHEKLPAKKCAAVLESIRNRTGKILNEPEF